MKGYVEGYASGTGTAVTGALRGAPPGRGWGCSWATFVTEISWCGSVLLPSLPSRGEWEALPSAAAWNLK